MISRILPEYKYLNIWYHEYCLNKNNILLAENRMNIGRDMVPPSAKSIFPPLQGNHYIVCSRRKGSIILWSSDFHSDSQGADFTLIHRGADKRQFHTTRVFCFLNIERSSVFFCVLRYVQCAWNILTPHSIFIQYSICCNGNSIHAADKE